MLWLAVLVGVLGAALSLALVAFGPRMGYSLRDPTDDERERLGRLRADLGASDLDVAIRTTNYDGAVECDVIGLPGRRTLVITDAALQALDDEALRALLAVEVARGRSRIQVAQSLSTGLAVGIIAAAYVTPIDFLPAMVVGWAIVIAGIALVRRQYYAADAAAGDLVGRETLRESVEWAAELRGDSLESGRLWRALFDVEPTVGSRIERLGGVAGSGQ
ncbi:hypothetical protein GCM10028857_22890 [Salinarchaeum chitinilyticum]